MTPTNNVYTSVNMDSSSNGFIYDLTGVTLKNGDTLEIKQTITIYADGHSDIVAHYVDVQDATTTEEAIAGLAEIVQDLR